MSHKKDRDLFDLDGKIAVITGGGSGIGRAVAAAYAAYGATTVIVDIDETAARSVAAEIAELSAESMTLQADVTQPRDVDRMVARTLEAYGRIDILFNNAGRSLRKPAAELSLEDWNKVIELNLTGMFLCAQAAGRVMIEQKRGKIINTASVSSALGHLNAVSYAASKHGVVGMMKVMANEWAHYNVNVNAIGPGVVRTPMTEGAFENQEMLRDLEAKVPMGRLGDTDDIVGAAVFLASRASDYITGQVIYIDGGQLVD